VTSWGRKPAFGAGRRVAAVLPQPGSPLRLGVQVAPVAAKGEQLVVAKRAEHLVVLQGTAGQISEIRNLFSCKRWPVQAH